MKPKPATDEQAERVTLALQETDRTGRAPDVVRDDPGRFLRDLYEVWHRQGGKEGGRWRNSIRKMRDQWLTGRNAVPSLHPKLMGRVKLTRKDVRALLDLFLGRWRYAENGGHIGLVSEDGYVAFSTTRPRRLRDLLVEALMPQRRTSMQLPLKSEERASLEETERRWVDVETVLNECDALITLSRHKISVGVDPVETIKTFWHLMNGVFEHDQQHNITNRLLIWIIDLGSRHVVDEDAFSEYFNTGLLALQLNSIASFSFDKKNTKDNRQNILSHLRIPDPLAESGRGRWFAERTAVVVQNLRLDDYNNLHPHEEELLSKIRLIDIGVTADQVLPGTTPGAWADRLRRLYGKDVTASDATLTVFFRDQPWIIGDQRRSIRYFAHSALNARARERKKGGLPLEAVSQSVELRSPGPKYDDAFRLVYWAARQRLKKTEDTTATMGLDALAYLRTLRFRVLSISEFLHVFAGVNFPRDEEASR